MKEIHIIGLGLIGGSFARDLRQLYPQAKFLGRDQNTNHLNEAKELGLIDGESQSGSLHAAEVVIVAIPVDATARELPRILDEAGEQTLVMDVGSTKAGICKAVANHPKRRNFLAAHPISGTEFSGPSAAILGLYQGKTNIICEVEQTAFKLQEKALEIFNKLGMRIRYMNPEAHDKHIAYVSHLSHISSFMLGKTVMDEERNERDIFDMAGSGFESTVRLAKSSPDTWTPIFMENKNFVLDTLNEYIANLQAFKVLLEEGQHQDMHSEMTKINHIKDILKGIE